MDNHTMVALGILDDCRSLLSRVKWLQFMESRRDTYLPITLEFLSSLGVKETEIDDETLKVIYFKLENTENVLTLAELNDIYRLPLDGENTKP